MSDISIKHQKHRAYPISQDKKIQLLKKLVAENSADSDKFIIVVSSEENEEILNNISGLNVQIIDDKTLYKSKDLKCDLLISFDVPQKSIVYISRLSHATDAAIVLVSKDEERLLYPVETLLGRAIKQEILAEFSDAPKEQEKKEYPSRDGKKPFKKKEFTKEDKAKAAQWEKKKKAPNKFLGKDEDGKAKFSGKTGDRNHSYDGTPKERKDYKMPKKTGRSVTIKGLKKKED